MVVGYTLSEIGDVLIVDTQLSITGTSIQLVSFTDSTLGVSPTRFFNKKFRVSQDGLIYTNWLDLTNANVSTISGNIINNTLYIQYRYERAGVDNTGLLEFVSVNIVGNVVPTACTSPVLDNSILKGLSCGNFVTMQLCNNLLKKLYRNGIIPEYINRGVVPEQDEDYIAFWSAIATYMAMFVTFIMRFENIYMDRELLLEYLKQLNIYNCEWETTTADLQYAVSRYYDEIRKRGTKQIFLKKNEVLQDSTLMPIDGEILRLLCVDDCDEFLWTLKEVSDRGFNIGNSSPMYKGTNFDNNLIKGFEKTKECLDLTKYKLFGASNINNLGGTINLTSSTGFDVGIGWQNFNAEPLVKDDGIVVNKNLDYEITFKIKVDKVSSNPRIDFGCHVYDCQNNKYFLRTIDFNNMTSLFKSGLKINKAGTYYFIRGVIYNIDQQPIPYPDCQLNTANGTNLKFDNHNTNKIMPYIRVLANDNSTVFNIYDLKVRPLRYDHSIGFLNTNNILEIFANNRNKTYNATEVYEIIRRDLIPYNTVLVYNDISANSKAPMARKFTNSNNGIANQTRIYSEAFDSSSIIASVVPASQIQYYSSTQPQWKDSPLGAGPSSRYAIWQDADFNNTPDLLPLGTPFIVNFDVLSDKNKKAYLGFNTKGAFEIYVNNSLIAYVPSPNTNSRNKYHILPVMLNQGTNNFRVVVKSTNSSTDCVTAVVYDNTAFELLTATSDTQLNILFKTNNLI